MNSKQWQKDSDEWVKTMHASNEKKQKKKDMAKNLIGYKVEIVFTQDKINDDPADWILDAVQEGKFKENTKHVHATSVSPIDLEDDEYKWLRDSTQG